MSDHLSSLLRGDHDGDPVATAATWIAAADGLLVAAGAGMGVDSGLPDFRGPQGFWRAYPGLGRIGLGFEEIANPRHFARDPALAWGFYGHRLDLYRRTVPHPGFALLRAIGARLAQGVFVFTSNVDGQFQRAGFAPAQVAEVHGSIHHLQCQHGCAGAIWTADDFIPEVDAAACRLLNEAPRCGHCGAVARPNILMFGDAGWLEARSAAQMARLRTWYGGAGRVVVIEIGAGTRVATVRHFSASHGQALIRINPQPEAAPPGPAVQLRCGALDGLRAIYAALAARGLVDAAQLRAF